MVRTLGRKDIIEFLVGRKFPPLVLVNLPAKPPPRGTTTLDRIVRHQEMERYRGELQALSDEELQAQHHSEQAKLVDEIQREEETRFFNQPRAAADFDHWSKAEHWSLEEAIALAMGKAPELVNWAKIQSYSQVSPFVQRYGRLRDLAHRAVPWKKLYDPVLPTIFLKWAKDNEITVPAELSEKVIKLKGEAADWKKNYDELHAMYDQHIADWKKIADQLTAEVLSGRKRVSELEQLLLDSETASVAPQALKPQSPVERQNMLKVIFSMAVRGYGYKPEDKRSPVVTEIVGDTALQGTPVSDDTVRRYLNEARECLPEWRESSR
jgi:hypothetical protein